MDRQILNITANEQILTVDEPIRISTNKVNYIEAHFDLGQNWTGYDSIRAVWFNDFYCISTVLDSQGVCLVPSEVMKRNGKVKVNLVGSISENDVLTDRLTSYPVVAVIVDCTAMANGAETAPITPSQFEQYVAIVRGLVDSVKDIDHIELNSDYTLTIYYSDGTSDTTGSVRGADGNGIESVTKTGTSGLVDTYTIMFTDGQTTTFNVTNGAKGDTGNGIASIEKTSTVGLVDTYTITYTNGTTSTFAVTNGEKGDKGDTGEVTLSQLYSILPTDSASGDIASFTDGADDVPMLSVKVQIEPIQDLHGYDKPWSGGAGKNKWSLENSYTSSSGATIIANEAFSLPSGTYTMSFGGTMSGAMAVTFRKADLTNITQITLSASDLVSGRYVKAFTASENVEKINVYVNNAVSINDIQIESGSATDYAPYSNICPIYGHTEVVTSVRAVNIWDEEWEVGDYSTTTGEKHSASNVIRCKNKIRVLPSTGYYFNAPYDVSSSGAYVYWYDANENYISYVRTYNKNITTPSNCHYMAFDLASVYGTTYNHDISINYPSTDTDYHAYHGQTYTTQFGQTVYGGSVDLVSGVLTVDRGYTELSEDWYWIKSSSYAGSYYASCANVSGMKVITPFMSSHAKSVTRLADYVSGCCYCDNSINFRIMSETSTLQDWKDYIVAQRTNGTPITICYELATPTTIQLTPQEIDSFKGQNNLWASTGEIEVEYRADIGLYVNKVLS